MKAYAKMYSTCFIAKVFLLAFFSVFSLLAAADAKVSAGDMIDDSNWEKVEGLIPDKVLNWVKNGEWTLDIQQLTFNPSEMYTDEVKEATKANQGKYDIHEQGYVVEKDTREVPNFIAGIPFPEIDEDDPVKAAYQVLNNSVYARNVCGNVDLEIPIRWIGPEGLERRVVMDYLTIPYVGHPDYEAISNPEKFHYKNIIHVSYPYDVAGTAVMLWRYLGGEPDVNFSYVPAIRRVRRMTPASRSDAFLGSDFCLDDMAGYDAKLSSFDMKVLRVQEAVVPYNSEKPYKMVDTPDGGVQISHDNKEIKFGYETEGWEGAAWAQTNLVWVKRPVYVIELTPKDPYYNYGTHELWVTKGRYTPCYKIIYDRSGEYWKTMVSPMVGVEGQNGKYKSIEYANLVMVDERSNHATATIQQSPDKDLEFIWMGDLNRQDFTISGFQKYCK